jgi:hypothetical protein
MERHGVACLIIDPQRDFHGGGSLAVPGADEVRPYLSSAEPGLSRKLCLATGVARCAVANCRVPLDRMPSACGSCWTTMAVKSRV